MTPSEQLEILQRIQSALEAARALLNRFTAGAIEAEYKAGRDPVTEADRALDALLREHLLREGEGWLSEETVDDSARLKKNHVWVVDPLDGTREFVAGIPEFCVSVAMVENGAPAAGGICNPASDQIFLGSIDHGVTCNGKLAQSSQKQGLSGSVVLASRSEIERGEWKKFERASFKIQPKGSVAYKLALVSVGLADATFTLAPKNEWDVAAGAALVQSSGGFVSTLDGTALTCNQRDPLLSGLLACGPRLKDELLALVTANLSVTPRPS